MSEKSQGFGNQEPLIPSRDKTQDVSVVAKRRFFEDRIVPNLQSFVIFVDQVVGFIVNRNVAHNDDDVIAYARSPIIFGLYVVFIFIICGGSWALFAPLDSAAQASAVVMPSGDMQRIHHIHGGKVKKIFARQGDLVNKGQVLMELCSADAKAAYEIRLNQYLDLLAFYNRLIAQRDREKCITFDEILIKNKKNPQVSKLLSVQTKIFREMADSEANTRKLLEQEIQKHLQRRESYHARKLYMQENLKYVAECLRINKELEKDGFASSSESERLLADKSRSEAELAETVANQAIIEKEIFCLEIRIKEDRNKRFEDTLRELKEVQSRLAESKEQYTAAKEMFDSLIVVSPMRGIINDLTKNSLIHQQSLIGEVTPIHSTLIVEARIPPQQIDSIVIGQESKIKFSAFKSRTSPSFVGRVISISPNTIDEGRGGPPYYVARIEMDAKELEGFLKPRDLRLIPGMTASVNIITGSRSLVRYLLDPVLDQAFRALKEK